MSGRLLLEGEDPDSVHRCPTPPPSPGALWVCDCGQHWLYGPSPLLVGMNSWKRVSPIQARKIIRRTQRLARRAR